MAETNPEPSDATAKPQKTLTPVDRIKELNEIGHSIAQLLHAAGEAIQILGSNSTATNLASAKSQFLESVTTYFTILSSIDVRLRRQVYALQEAGLITEGDAKDAKKGASAAGAGVGGSAGGGQLDLSWLNSRGDQVEKDMEREVWRKAREFIERLLEQRGRPGQVQRNGDFQNADTEHRREGGGDDKEERIEDQKNGG
jgi:Mediator complex protein